MDSNKEQHIIDSYVQNAKPWITAIAQREIESRNLVTNKAIVDAILSKGPRTVLDIGCGEGWLVRALSEVDIAAQGIDVVPALVREAERLGEGTFKVLSYEELGAGLLTDKFDLVVCNFSLLGEQSVVQVFQAISCLLKEEGYFLVQTVHPISACGEEVYEDGWRKGSWTGFNKDFRNPPPWYFRTMETWKALFAEHGIDLREILEPRLPGTDTFASVIFIGKVREN